MKLVSTIARYLLGLMFVVFGLNGFLHFIPQPPPASPVAQQFMTAVSQSGYFMIVFLLQAVSGLLLLANRYVAVALVILAAIILNILDYHVTMDPAHLLPGVVVAILWMLVFQSYRGNFRGLFSAGPLV